MVCCGDLQDITGWGENDRGVSFTFGGDVVRQFLKKHTFSLIARAHQVRAQIIVVSVRGSVHCAMQPTLLMRDNAFSKLLYSRKLFDVDSRIDVRTSVAAS